nr:ABC transporter ATP-binding protein [Nitratireductor aquibiodomus]
MAFLLSSHTLSVSYGPKGARVLDGFSAGFAHRRFTALVGPNGCGKSTFLKTVMGFLKPVSGEVTLDGQPIAGIGRRALARRIAYLPQENFCPDYLSVGELVELGGYARYSLFGGPSDADRKAFLNALATVGLSDMGHLPVNRLSGGQRQRAWIAWCWRRTPTSSFWTNRSTISICAFSIRCWSWCATSRSSGARR